MISLQDLVPPKSLRLLFTEDDDHTGRTLSRLLSRCGREVSSTDTFELAIKLLESKQFDAVVSDIALPDRSGYEPQWLRANRVGESALPD
jgi:DNA-binding response OmpR family regulator